MSKLYFSASAKTQPTLATLALVYCITPIMHQHTNRLWLDSPDYNPCLSNFSSFRLPAGNCTSSLSLTRTKSRKWVRKRSRFRTRRVKLPPAGSATKPSLPMAVATSVLIAKRNSVRGAEDECLCGQIR